MKIRAVPNSAFRLPGVHGTSMWCSFLLFGNTRMSSYPPAESNFGNARIIFSCSSIAVAVALMCIFLSPKPDAFNDALDVGAVVVEVLAKQTRFRVICLAVSNGDLDLQEEKQNLN